MGLRGALLLPGTLPLVEKWTKVIKGKDFNPTSTPNAPGTVRGQPDSPRFAYRLIYCLKNFVHRSALHPGSSGVILCWKEHFVRTGGFDEALEVRENSQLLKRLKRFGSYKYLPYITATTSMRRYQQQGVHRVVFLWIKLWLESLLGDLRKRRYETVR